MRKSVKALRNVKDLISNQSKEKAKTIKSFSEKAWIGAAASVGDLSEFISQTDWVKGLNGSEEKGSPSQLLSKAMDAGFKIGKFDPETALKMSPNNHRILDGGHGFFESIEKAQEVAKEQNWSDTETFFAWLQSYFTDLSSPAGMPAFDSFADNIYDFLIGLGISEPTARDLVIVNGQEAIEALVGGTLSAVGLVFSWKAKDKEGFSKVLGSLGLAGVISMNPLLLVVLVVAAAIGYNTLVCRKGISRGVMASGAAVLTGAIIPGPVVLGLIPGVVVAMYVSKKLDKDFDFITFSQGLWSKLSNKDSRSEVLQNISNCVEMLKSKSFESKGAA